MLGRPDGHPLLRPADTLRAGLYHPHSTLLLFFQKFHGRNGKRVGKFARLPPKSLLQAHSGFCSPGSPAPGWATGIHVPFSTLREQGSSKLFLTLGQAAWVFQVLAKAAAAPSTTPLRVRKSSAWFWLKFPHRPGAGGQHETPRAPAAQGGLRLPGQEAPLTARPPAELGPQPHKHLHERRQLDTQLQAQVGLGNDEEGRGSEEGDVGCGHRGQGLSGL